jgi:hypothetical protein
MKMIGQFSTGNGLRFEDLNDVDEDDWSILSRKL